MALFDKKDLEKMLSDIKTELAKKPGKKKIVYVDASSDTTVTAGSNETITIQPPEGKIWRIIEPVLTVPQVSGASSGNQHFFIRVSIHSDYDYIFGQNNYNKTLSLKAIPYEVASSIPSDDHTYYLMITRLKFSHDRPLVIKYWNNTDADQANTRHIKLLIEEEDEAE